MTEIKEGNKAPDFTAIDQNGKKVKLSSFKGKKNVVLYFYPKDMEALLDKIKKINPNCELILSLGKQNLISKLALYATFNFNYHDNIRSTYKEQVEIFLKKTALIKKKLNIYAMTDIFYSKF